MLSDLAKDTLRSPSSTNLTAISFMLEISTLLKPLADWIPSLSTIVAVTSVFAPVAVLMPGILKLLPSVIFIVALVSASKTPISLPVTSFMIL